MRGLSIIKRLVSFGLSFIFLLTLSGCNQSGDRYDLSKTEFEIIDYTLFHSGLYVNSPLHMDSCVSHEKELWDRSNSDDDKSFNVFKWLSSKTLEIDGIKTKLGYKISVGNASEKIDGYISSDNTVTAEFRNRDDRLVRYSREILGEDIGERVVLSQEEWVKKATEVLTEYIDLNRYTLQHFAEKERSEYIVYELIFRRYVCDFATTDNVSVKFAQDGTLMSFSINNAGEYDRIENVEISKDEMDKQVQKSVDKLAERYVIDSSSYDYGNLIWTKDGDLALLVNISITASGEYGEPFKDIEGDLILDENENPVKYSDSIGVYVLFD